MGVVCGCFFVFFCFFLSLRWIGYKRYGATDKLGRILEY